MVHAFKAKAAELYARRQKSIRAIEGIKSNLVF
jgi:uncharacterized protein YegP (UPF0339 family)